MKKNSLIIGVFISTLVLSIGTNVYFQTEAEEKGEKIIKEKSLTREFDEENPEGEIDLKKIIEEELERPEECNDQLMFCQIQKVGFDITIRKEWVKYNLTEFNNYEYANTVPRLEKNIDQLSKPDIVVLQETLDRRGLLTYLDGSSVHERGFFGALTWMGLIRLGHIKGLSDEDPEFEKKLTDEVNKLLDNMANDENYVTNRPLPKKEAMEPGTGDDLYDLWKHYHYLANLAQNAKKVETGNIPLDINNDVNIDGFLNVERVD